MRLPLVAMQPLGSQCPGTGMGVEVEPFVDDLGVAGDQDVARPTEFHQRVARLH